MTRPAIDEVIGPRSISISPLELGALRAPPNVGVLRPWVLTAFAIAGCASWIVLTLVVLSAELLI